MLFRSEEAALADVQGTGELADGEAFETFQRSDVDGFAEDGATGFQAAGAARRLLCCGGSAAWWRCGILGACVHCAARIIARPFVLLQCLFWRAISVRSLALEYL